jgi:hypothetical protein
MHRGIRNQVLFEAYVEYCFSPKHTVGEQLLDVRRDKRERNAFAVAGQAAGGLDEEEEENSDGNEEESYHVEMAEMEAHSIAAQSIVRQSRRLVQVWRGGGFRILHLQLALGFAAETT